MRWSLLAVIAIAAGCNWPAGTSTSGAGGSTPDAGGPSCASSNTCATCPTCALHSPCATLWATCQASPACLSIDGCATACSDSTCLQGCYAQNPDGAADYQAVHSCVYCQECTCAGMCS